MVPALVMEQFKKKNKRGADDEEHTVVILS
jgi:hypothetical protein